MKITERQRKTIRAALDLAAEWELSLMDANRDKYSDDWRPGKGLGAGYRDAERARKRYLKLRKTLARP